MQTNVNHEHFFFLARTYSSVFAIWNIIGENVFKFMHSTECERTDGVVEVVWPNWMVFGRLALSEVCDVNDAGRRRVASSYLFFFYTIRWTRLMASGGFILSVHVLLSTVNENIKPFISHLWPVNELCTIYLCWRLRTRGGGLSKAVLWQQQEKIGNQEFKFL